MGRPHIELAVSAGNPAFDAITGFLSIEGFQGFWEDGGTLRAYIGEECWDARRLDAIRMSLTRITDSFSLPPPALALTSVAFQNWNRTWEETIRPIRVTERIVVAPTWHPFAGRADEIVLTIDPKMSFGTGYHESTRLILGLIESRMTPGVRFLDAGTGTGILAIAAVRLGAASAVGFDTDEWAFENAVENVRLNGVSDRIAIRRGDLAVVTEPAFGLIAANIQRNVIEDMLPGLAARLAPAGTLLLSGLLEGDAGPIGRRLGESGLSIAEERRDGEWIALAAGRS
jgi:ribosomal protein L11 methyltransferase